MPPESLCTLYRQNECLDPCSGNSVEIADWFAVPGRQVHNMVRYKGNVRQENHGAANFIATVHLPHTGRWRFEGQFKSDNGVVDADSSMSLQINGYFVAQYWNSPVRLNVLVLDLQM